MKKAVLAIAAVLSVALTASPSFAQRGGGKEAAQKAAAMEKTPALVASAGVPCKVVDARSIGTFGRVDAGKKVNFEAFEVACETGIGYVVSAVEKGGPVRADDCLAQEQAAVAAGGKSPLTCQLPGNAEPAKALKPILVAGGSSCDPVKGRLMGLSGASRVYELACSNGSGQILVTAKDANSQPTVVSCLSAAAQGQACTLSTTEQNLAAVKGLAAKYDKPCTVSNQRFVLNSTQGEYYEFACSDGTGFMVLSKNGTEFVRAVPCAQAGGVGGGCTLTDAKAAQTAEAATYTKEAKAAGFDCNVSKYGVFPATGGGKEVVELACGNRPDGAVAIFTGNGPGQILNCARSQAEGYRCSYTPIETAYKAVTEQLKAKGKMTCDVNGVRAMGSNDQETFLEVTCADGDPGWVVRYPRGVNTPTEVLSCLQASGVGGGCAMPQNKRRS